MTTDYHLNEAQVRLLAAAFDTSEFFDEEDCPQYVRFDFPFPSPNGEPRSLAVSLQWGDAWAIGSTIAEAVGTNLAEQIMGRRGDVPIWVDGEQWLVFDAVLPPPPPPAPTDREVLDRVLDEAWKALDGLASDDDLSGLEIELADSLGDLANAVRNFLNDDK